MVLIFHHRRGDDRNQRRSFEKVVIPQRRTRAQATSSVRGMADPRDHWQRVWTEKPADQVSWYQPDPQP